MTQTATAGAGIRSDGVKARREGAAPRKFYGLVELDAAGTVLYVRFESDGAQSLAGAPDCAGLNFYAQVAPFRNVAEFKNRLDGFMRGSQPAHSMDFTCDYEDGPVLVRVLFARIRERTQADVTKSVLVHIRRAQ
ncbi:MAG TPA: hypothetical protein VF621_04585 [Pyrinomonadaceae bacterium]|jgi:hypothetical protein